MSGHAGAFAAVFAALYAAHQVGDHWVQTGTQAACKGSRDRAGRAACAGHVTTLTITKVAALLAVALACGLHFSTLWLPAGLAVDAVSHYWADRRFTLAALAGLLGKADFYRLGAPRRVRGFVLDPTDQSDDPALLDVLTYETDQSAQPLHPAPHQVIPRPFDNPTLGTGAYALDQSWHIGWLFVTALLIAVGVS